MWVKPSFEYPARNGMLRGAEQLGFKQGDKATVASKATEVMLEKD
jgi:hypothetical protein